MGLLGFAAYNEGDLTNLPALELNSRSESPEPPRPDRLPHQG